MTTATLTKPRPFTLRSQADLARALQSLPAAWRDLAFADEAHERAAREGDEEETLFWSEVLTLLRACDEAGVSPSSGGEAESTSRPRRRRGGHWGLRWMLHA